MPFIFKFHTQVNHNNGNVNMSLKSEDSVEITTKSYTLKSLKKKDKTLQYGSFLKTSTLTQNGMINETDDVEDTTDNLSPPKFKVLNDDELLAACGGRTAHK